MSDLLLTQLTGLREQVQLVACFVTGTVAGYVLSAIHSHRRH